jgi:hypothetical protein
MSSTNRNPIINTYIVNARTPASTPDQKVLIVGQSNSANVTDGALVTEVGSDETVIKTKFGAKEHITQSILAFRENNKVNRLDCIALNDGAGTDATGTIVIGGTTATENGTLYVSVGSENAHRLTIPVTSGDTPTIIGDAIDTAVLADSTIPVTSANVTGTVTFTAVNAGTEGNFIGLKVEGEVAGITATITAMSGGATDPTLTTLYDVIEDVRYNVIIIPSYASAGTITELDNRFNPSNQVVDGIAIYTLQDTFANIGTALDALNTRSLIVSCNKLLTESDQKGGAILEQPQVIAARIGAIKALRLTEGANIAKYMVNNLTTGGIKLNGYPYANTPIAELPLAPTGKNFSKTEIATLVGKNGTTLVNDSSNTKIIMNETFVTSTSVTKSRITAEETLRAIREVRFFRMKDRYAQHKLGTTGQEKNGEAIVTKESFIADSLGDWQYFVDNGLIRTTTADGESTKTIWKETMEQTITINFLTGTITDDFLAHITTELARVDENIIPDFN